MDKLGPSNPSAKPGPGLMRNSMIFGIFSPNQDVQVDRKMDYVKKDSGIGKVIHGEGLTSQNIHAVSQHLRIQHIGGGGEVLVSLVGGEGNHGSRLAFAQIQQVSSVYVGKA